MRTLVREQQDHVEVLRIMLAELMVKQSSLVLTEDERRLHKQGIQALQAAVEAIESQVYA